MTLYQRLTAFVDHDVTQQGGQTGSYSVLLALIFAAIWVSLARSTIGVTSIVIQISGIGITLLWVSFVGWRLWRRIKASAIAADREYDEVTKYQLAEEYHSTESSSKAENRHQRDNSL